MWHTPIDLYAGFGVKGSGAILIWILWALPISIVFTWFYLRSKGSLLVAMFLHTSMNTLSDLGFSKFEYSLIFLFLLMMGAALLFALSSKEFQSATDCAGTHP